MAFEMGLRCLWLSAWCALCCGGLPAAPKIAATQQAVSHNPTPSPTPFTPYEPRLRATEPANGATGVSKELKRAVLKFDQNFPVTKGSGVITVYEWTSKGDARLFSSVNVSSPLVTVAEAGDLVSVPLYPYADDETDDAEAAESRGGAGKGSVAPGASAHERDPQTRRRRSADAHHHRRRHHLNHTASPIRFGTRYEVRVPEGALRAQDDAHTPWRGIGAGGGTDGYFAFAFRHEANRWRFQIEAEPQILAEAVTQNTTVHPHRVEMWGVGVFVVDVGAVDLKAGTFYADLQLYLLRYYRTFAEPEDAIKEATLPAPDGVSGGYRACNTLGKEGSHWLFFSNVTGAQIFDKLNFINIGRFPKMLPLFKRTDPLASTQGGGSAGVAGSASISTPPLVGTKPGSGTLDHIRVQSDFYFAPALREYPFQAQSLPIKLEISGAALERKPRYLMCALPRFSGFAEELSSFRDGSSERLSLKASFDIVEQPFWPPNEGIQTAGDAFTEMLFPHRFAEENAQRAGVHGATGGSSGTSRAHFTSREASRLHFVMRYYQGWLLGMLQLAPALFIGVTALANFALPYEEYRTRLTAVSSALLAAIVQHSSIRSGIQQQSIATWADLVMGVVYLLILTSFVSTVAVAILHKSTGGLRKYAAEVHRGFGLLSLSLLLLLLVFTFDDPSSAVAWASAVSAVLTAFLALLALHWISFTRDRRHGDQLASQLRPVEDWTVSDVRAWLVSCARSKGIGDDACRSSDGCPRPRSAGLIGAAALRSYADLFAHNFVDGAVLLELTPGDVRALGVPFGHSLKIHAAIAQLAEQRGMGASARTASSPGLGCESGLDDERVSLLVADTVSSSSAGGAVDRASAAAMHDKEVELAPIVRKRVGGAGGADTIAIATSGVPASAGPGQGDEGSGDVVTVSSLRE